MNEGGKVPSAATPPASNIPSTLPNEKVRPQGRDRLQNPLPAGTDPRRCLPLFGSFFGGDTTNDVLQYYLRLRSRGQRRSRRRRRVRLDRRRRPVHGPHVGLDDPIFAGNTFRRSSFLATSGILPVDQFKQFDKPGRGAVRQAGRPVRPTHRNPVRYSQIADVSYKRPHPGGRRPGGWRVDDVLDVVRHRTSVGPPVVEARTPGGDDWTTLPDANGHTTTATGQSCPAGWVTLHPHLAHYQTFDGRGPARPPAPAAPGTPPAATCRLAAVEHRPLGVRR